MRSLESASEEIEYYVPLFEKLKRAAESVGAGQVIYVRSPRLKA
jgi:hypothetical protein